VSEHVLLIGREEAVWYANTDLRGHLVKIVGIEEADPGVTVLPLAPPGTSLDGLSSNYSRLAEARAYAAEPGQALAMARDAIRGLKIVVHAAPADPD
jgi:hypothetical protein